MQDIVISPDVFKKLAKYYSDPDEDDIDLKSYKENLELKKLVLDNNTSKERSEILEQIKNIIKNSSDFSRKKIETILNQFLLSDRIGYQNNLKWEKFVSNKDHNLLINVGRKIDSGIIHSCDKELENTVNLLANFNHKELRKVEVVDINKFINPPRNSKLLCTRRVISYNIGEEFQFEEILRPYICSTKKMEIFDEYIRKKERGLFNLKRILKLCDSLEQLKIYTWLGDKPGLDISAEELKDELEKEFNKVEVKLYRWPKGKGTREIITDDFLIEVEHEIYFVDKDYKALNDPTELRIRHKRLASQYP